jgi:hypothetical protein
MTSSSLRHKPTLFIDRNSGGRIFRSLIVSNDFDVVLHDDHYKGIIPSDPEWLRDISKLGWIMISGDMRTSRSPLFLAELAKSNARVFLLNGLNGESREGKAKCVIESYAAISRICEKFEAPFLWGITKDHRAYSIDFRQKLGVMRRSDSPHRNK